VPPVGVGRDVLPDAAGPPLGVRSDLDRGAGQEVLRPEDEGVVGLVTIESLGQGDRLAPPDDSIPEGGRHQPDALAEAVVVAVTAEPGKAKSGRLEGQKSTLEQSREDGVAMLADKEVGCTRPPVRHPEDVVGPAGDCTPS